MYAGLRNKSCCLPNRLRSRSGSQESTTSTSTSQGSLVLEIPGVGLVQQQRNGSCTNTRHPPRRGRNTLLPLQDRILTTELELNGNSYSNQVFNSRLVFMCYHDDDGKRELHLYDLYCIAINFFFPVTNFVAVALKMVNHYSMFHKMY